MRFGFKLLTSIPWRSRARRKTIVRFCGAGAAAAIARRACRGAESAPHRGRPMRRRIAAASRPNRGRIAAESPSNPWRIGGDSVTIGLRSAAALPARLARARGAANADADADADATDSAFAFDTDDADEAGEENEEDEEDDAGNTGNSAATVDAIIASRANANALANACAATANATHDAANPMHFITTSMRMRPRMREHRCDCRDRWDRCERKRIPRVARAARYVSMPSVASFL